MSKPVLLARGLRKSYREGGRHLDILKGVDLSVNAMECLAITGASGVGKSTLLHVLGGLEKLDSGEVYIADEALHELDADGAARLRNRHLGFVYQFHHLLPEFSAEENVAMPLLIGGSKRSSALVQSRELLALLGLSARATHRPGELSGGERQRVAIGRALVTQPVCVLMDEPTGNLDQETAGKMQDLLLKLNVDLKIALLVVTHNLSFARAMGQTLKLQDGVLQQEMA